MRIIVCDGRARSPRPRIQERARAARYRLLCGRARDIGATAIVTAHHADDQAETALFRLTRGSGVAGLAAMAIASRVDGLALLRPLLGFRKAALERLCAEAGHPYFRDPSNENPAYARVRLRRLAATLAAEGLDVEALLRLSARAARAEEALAWSAEQAASTLPAERGEKRFRVAAEALRALPRELLLRLLAAEIARIGSGEPRLERLERAGARLADALATETRFKTTLGGATVTFSTPPSSFRQSRRDAKAARATKTRDGRKKATSLRSYDFSATVLGAGDDLRPASETTERRRAQRT